MACRFLFQIHYRFWWKTCFLMCGINHIYPFIFSSRCPHEGHLWTEAYFSWLWADMRIIHWVLNNITFTMSVKTKHYSHWERGCFVLFFRYIIFCVGSHWTVLMTSECVSLPKCLHTLSPFKSKSFILTLLSQLVLYLFFSVAQASLLQICRWWKRQTTRLNRPVIKSSDMLFFFFHPRCCPHPTSRLLWKGPEQAALQIGRSLADLCCHQSRLLTRQ